MMADYAHHGITFHCFDNRSALVDAIKDATLSKLAASIEKNGAATWAVSGGSTPAPLFEAMTKTEFKWPAVHVALVDERWVAAEHPRSNEAFIKDNLLKGQVAKAPFKGMYRDTPSASLALSEVEASYNKLPKPFSNILLGMGNDGHTASLFPAADGLETALASDYFALCAAIHAKKSDITGGETERMTLTLNAIKEAESCFLMITGDQKLATLKNALENDTHLPIARVVHALPRPLDVFWSP